MKHFTYFFAILSFITLASCDLDGGAYETVNPPFDGSVIGGNPAEPQGFLRGSFNNNSENCTDETCTLTLANRYFGTFITPAVPEFLSNANPYAISISNNSQDTIYYIYKKNEMVLERNRSDYKNGIFPYNSAYNLITLQDEAQKDILKTGTLTLKKTAKHPENTLFFYFQLKNPLLTGEKLTVCTGIWDIKTNQLGTANCGEITAEEQ